MNKLLELLEKLVRAIFGPGNEAETTPDAPATAPEQVNTPPGWEGEPPLSLSGCKPVAGKNQNGGLAGYQRGWLQGRHAPGLREQC